MCKRDCSNICGKHNVIFVYWMIKSFCVTVSLRTRRVWLTVRLFKMFFACSKATFLSFTKVIHSRYIFFDYSIEKVEYWSMSWVFTSNRVLRRGDHIYSSREQVSSRIDAGRKSHDVTTREIPYRVPRWDFKIGVLWIRYLD